jgi:hypothetical protein
MSREMLDRWASKQDDRKVIAEFFEWLVRTAADTAPEDVDIERALDNFHGIDRAELDRERRELLADARDALGRGKKG